MARLGHQGDGDESGRTEENQIERIRGLKKKINFTNHSQTWDLLIFELGSEHNINIVSFHKAYCIPSFFVLI